MLTTNQRSLDGKVWTAANSLSQSGQLANDESVFLHLAGANQAQRREHVQEGRNRWQLAGL
jgi:hypothetical protein